MTKDFSELIKEINKSHGEGTINFFGDMKAVKVNRISTGLPSLDLILGGGIPEGRFIEIYGPESSGKTTLSIKFLAEVQKKYPDKRVAFIDVEHALDPDYAKNLGLNMDEVLYCPPDSAEEALDVLETLVASGNVKAVILDSIASLVPMKEVEGEMGDSEMGMRARLLSKACRKIPPLASKNQCTCFFINQIRSSFNAYGPTETRPGGKGMDFAASQIIRTSIKQAAEEGVGIVKMQVKKNKVGKPYQDTTVNIRYGEGFDYLQDLITTAMKTGIVSQAGPYYKYADQQWKGEEAMRKAIVEDEKLQKEIERVIIDSLT